MNTFARSVAALIAFAAVSVTTMPTRSEAKASARRDPLLQSVYMRGITNPDGKALPDTAIVECRVYDPNKSEATGTIAHALGTAGAGEFEVTILNNEYTQEALKGCRCAIEIHGKGEANWDVTPYLTFKFFDSSMANFSFSRIKLGTGEGYKPKYDLPIPTL